MEEYPNEFMSILNFARDVSLSVALKTFINGLKEEIKIKLILRDSQIVRVVKRLAKAAEDKINDSKFQGRRGYNTRCNYNTRKEDRMVFVRSAMGSEIEAICVKKKIQHMSRRQGRVPSR